MQPPPQDIFLTSNDSAHGCKEWLRQVRTCPVCHMDLPGSLGILDNESGNERQRSSLTQNGILLTRGPFRSEEFQQDLVNLVSLLRETGGRR